MNLPSALPTLILVMGAYRLTRLGGWDDWPPIARTRALLLGEHWVSGGGSDAVELPGKTPESEVGYLHPAYDRPTLAHLVHCPFCLGWWVSLAVTVCWYIEPTWTTYALSPFALSGAVGIVAKNLDA